MIRSRREWRQHLLQALTQRPQLAPRQTTTSTTERLHSTGNQCTVLRSFPSGLSITSQVGPRSAQHSVISRPIISTRAHFSPVNKILEVGSMVNFSGSIACSGGGRYSPQRARLFLGTIFKTFNLSSEPVYGTRGGLRDLGLRKCGEHRPRQELPGARHRLEHLPLPSTETSPDGTSGKTKPRCKRRLKKGTKTIGQFGSNVHEPKVRLMARNVRPRGPTTS
ncbi:hypothetical protein QBC45DRAFT_447344 [Copromyces sp. CBS 386.78]|nr:hypothetical protein QBC45DRAFT_447344 [Copromyces sp. CBS 386.78]